MEMQPQAEITIKSSLYLKLFIFPLLLFFIFCFYATLTPLFDPVQSALLSPSRLYSGPAFLLVMVLMIGFFANISVRKVTLRGTVLTVRRRLIFPRVVSMDLSRLADVSQSSFVYPVRYGSRRYYYLTLTDDAGVKLRLDLAYYNRRNQAVLVKALSSFIARSGVVKAESRAGVESTLQYWDKDFKQLDANQPAATFNRRPSKWLMIILLSLCMVVAFSVLYILAVGSGREKKERCNDIVNNGVTVTAEVDYVDLLRRADGFGRRRGYTVTTDLKEAIRIEVGVRFYADVFRTENIVVDYSNVVEMKNFYEDAKDGSMQVRYPKSDPSKVRPSSEFTSGKSCS